MLLERVVGLVVIALRCERDKQRAPFKAMLEDMRGGVHDLRRDRDEWRTQAQALRLALPKPEPKPQTWWQWLRSTG
jgi:hypothetical protein